MEHARYRLVDEDDGDERGEDLVGEARESMNEPARAGQPERNHEQRSPQSDPGVGGEEGKFVLLAGAVEEPGEYQERAGAPADGEGLPGEYGVDHTTSAGRHDHLDGAHGAASEPGHQGAKCHGRGRAGEKRNPVAAATFA